MVEQRPLEGQACTRLYFVLAAGERGWSWEVVEIDSKGSVAGTHLLCMYLRQAGMWCVSWLLLQLPWLEERGPRHPHSTSISLAALHELLRKIMLSTASGQWQFPKDQCAGCDRRRRHPSPPGSRDWFE